MFHNKFIIASIETLPIEYKNYVNRPYLYWYWTRTSLQLRPMGGVFSKANIIYMLMQGFIISFFLFSVSNSAGMNFQLAFLIVGLKSTAAILVRLHVHHKIMITQ